MGSGARPDTDLALSEPQAETATHVETAAHHKPQPTPESAPRGHRTAATSTGDRMGTKQQQEEA